MSQPLLTLEEVELLLEDIETKLDRDVTGPEACVWLPLVAVAIRVGGWTQYLPRLRAIFAHHHTPRSENYSFIDAVEASVWFKDKIDTTLTSAFTHETDDVVFGAVRGLDLALPGAQKLLQKATRHSNSALARLAKSRLDVLAPQPWWVGILSRDPAETVDPDTLEAHTPTLASLAKAMTKDWFAADDAWIDKVSTLPPPLALDLFVQQVRSPSRLWRDEKFWKLWWSLPGALPEYLALLRTTPEMALSDVDLNDYIGADSPLWHELVTSALTPEVMGHDPGPPDILSDDVEWALTQLEQWPLGLDPAPLLALLEQFGLDHPRARVLLNAVIRGGRGAQPWVEKVFEHFLRTGEWRPRSVIPSELQKSLPTEILQRYITEAATITLAPVRLWRLQQLVEAAEDPPALSNYLISLLDDPEIGPEVAREHGAWVYESLRARLGRGALTPELATHLLYAHSDTQAPFEPQEMAQLRALRSAEPAWAAKFLARWPEPLTPDDWTFYDGLVTQPKPPLRLLELLAAIHSLSSEGQLGPDATTYLERWSPYADRGAATLLDMLLKRGMFAD